MKIEVLFSLIKKKSEVLLVEKFTKGL